MQSHRNLIAWQVAHEVALACHRYGARHWHPTIAPPLDQLRRAALSVELNIVEGYALGRGPRCRYHFRVAFASAAETAAAAAFLVDADAPAIDDLRQICVLAERLRALTLRLYQKS